MEMRVENNYEETEQDLGQVINMKTFESFVWNSDMGIRLINEKGESEEFENEEIMDKLNPDFIHKVYYIKNNNSVKILFTNGCIHELERV